MQVWDIPIWRATCLFFSFYTLLFSFLAVCLTCNFIFLLVVDFQFHLDTGNALALVTLSLRNIQEIMLQSQFFAILRCLNLTSNFQHIEGSFQRTTRENLHHITLLQDLFSQLYLYHIFVPRYIWVYTFISGKYFVVELLKVLDCV